MTELERVTLDRAEGLLMEAYQLLYAGLHIHGMPCGPLLDKIAGASLILDKMKLVDQSKGSRPEGK